MSRNQFKVHSQEVGHGADAQDLEKDGQADKTEIHMQTMNDEGDIQLIDDMEMFSLHEEALRYHDKDDDDDDDDDKETNNFEDSQRIRLMPLRDAQEEESIYEDDKKFATSQNGLIQINSNLLFSSKQTKADKIVTSNRFNSLKPMQAKRPPIPNNKIIDPAFPQSLRHFDSIEPVVFQDFNQSECQKKKRPAGQGAQIVRSAISNNSSFLDERPSFLKRQTSTKGSVQDSLTVTSVRPILEEKRNALSFRNLFKMFPKKVQRGLRNQFVSLDFSDDSDKGSETVAANNYEEEKQYLNQDSRQSGFSSIGETIEHGTIPNQVDLTSLDSHGSSSDVKMKKTGNQSAQQMSQKVSSKSAASQTTKSELSQRRKKKQIVVDNYERLRPQENYGLTKTINDQLQRSEAEFRAADKVKKPYSLDVDAIENHSMSVLSQKKLKAEAAVLKSDLKQEAEDIDLISVSSMAKRKKPASNIQMEFPPISDLNDDSDDDLCEVDIAEVLNHRIGAKKREQRRQSGDF